MNRKTAVIDATGYRSETALTLGGEVVGIQNANGEKLSFDIDAPRASRPPPRTSSATAMPTIPKLRPSKVQKHTDR